VSVNRRVDMRGIALVVGAGDIWTAALKELPEGDKVRSVLFTGVIVNNRRSTGG